MEFMFLLKNHYVLQKEEIYKIKRVLKKSSCKIFFKFCFKNKKTFKHLKSIIDKQKFGKTYYFEGDYNFGRLEKLRWWKVRILSYSVMHGGGIHLIDLIMWINNKKITKVFAEVTIYQLVTLNLNRRI